MSSGPAHPGVLVGVDGSAGIKGCCAVGRARGNGAQCSAHPRARRIHARGQLTGPVLARCSHSRRTAPMAGRRSRKGHGRRDQARRRQRHRRCSARDQVSSFFVGCHSAAAAGKRSRKVSPSWGVFRLMASPPEASRPEAPTRSSSGRRRSRSFGLDPFPHTGQPVPPLVLLQTAADHSCPQLAHCHQTLRLAP